MEISSVCRICLAAAVNTELQFLKNNLLINVYEKISNSKFNCADARPRALCCFCYQKLLRYHNFSVMARRSETILTNLFSTGLEATQEYITMIKLEIKQQLSITTLQSITIDGETTDAVSQVTIKDEPLDIKEEVTLEQHSLVKVESVSENMSEEDNSDQETDMEELPSNSYIEQTKSEGTKMSKIFQHMKNHTNKKPFSCNVSEEHFSHKSSLIRRHTREKPYACHICDKRFSQKHGLISHIRIHTGEKPFACNVCDKKFSHQTSLVTHMRIHTGERPFVCNVCGKRFIEKQTLVTHMRSHTGEKPFICNICDKKFTRNSYKMRHMRIHAGRKPLACNFCKKTEIEIGEV